MQRNPKAVETAKAGKADRMVERGPRSQIPQRESEGQEREPRQSEDETEQGQGAEQPGESSEAEPNLITETSSKEMMSQGLERSEVAKRNERKRPRGKGTHADSGRNPKRDGKRRGKQGAGDSNRPDVT